MIRALLVTFTVIALFSACTQRMICPAFQSAYIYDKDALRKKFSYFREDSTPKLLTASKTKYLIAEPVTYRKKIRSMYTVAMKPVNPVVPDSLKIDDEGDVVIGAELDLAARSVIDSIYIEDVYQDAVENAEDTVYAISKDKEIRFLKYHHTDSLVYDPNTGKYFGKAPKYQVAEITFNVDQDNYMWYLRDYLVLPDVRIVRMRQEDRKESETKEKKEKKGFFKNLFKKKKREQADTTLHQKPVKTEDDFDYVEEDEQLQPRPTDDEKPAKEKKGLFSRQKKDTGKTSNGDSDPIIKPEKKKKEKKVKQPKQKEPEEEKVEDDGF